MALSAVQFHEIQEILSDRRFSAEREALEKEKEVLDNVPGYAALDEELRRLSLSAIVKAQEGDSRAIAALRPSIRKIRDRKEEALKIVNRYSRDNARTPMQWTGGENAGFTTGKPWLPVNPNYTRINVESQEKDPHSVLSYYKALCALRKREEYKEAVVYGEFIPFLEQEDRLMAFYRKGEKKTLLVLGNYRKEEREVEIPGTIKKLVLSNVEPRINGNRVKLSGYEALILEVE